MINLDNFKALLLTADPDADKWKGKGQGDRTIWYPSQIVKIRSDDMDDDSWLKIQVNRFTKSDSDPIVSKIYDTLTQAGIPFEYIVDYEEDTDFINHIFTCFYR